jgi:hypothetical protein
MSHVKIMKASRNVGQLNVPTYAGGYIFAPQYGMERGREKEKGLQERLDEVLFIIITKRYMGRGIRD